MENSPLMVSRQILTLTLLSSFLVMFDIPVLQRVIDWYSKRSTFPIVKRINMLTQGEFLVAFISFFHSPTKVFSANFLPKVFFFKFHLNITTPSHSTSEVVFVLYSIFELIGTKYILFHICFSQVENLLRRCN